MMKLAPIVTTQTLSRLVILITLVLISGCETVSLVWAPYDNIVLVAQPSLNPDINQRPSPIQVKIYELSSRTTFDNLNFEDSFTQGETLLSKELVSSANYTLQPDETIRHKVMLQPETNYIAIIAAYRDIDNAKWKFVYEISPHSHSKHTVTLSKLAILKGKVTNKTPRPPKVPKIDKVKLKKPILKTKIEVI